MSTLDDVKNSGSSSILPDSSVRSSEISTVQEDAVCISINKQDSPPSHTNEERFSAEKARIESEMDSSDISNVSAANLVRTTYQNYE